METESHKLAYICFNDGSIRIDVGDGISKNVSEFYEDVTIEYHGDVIVVHCYRRETVTHHDSHGFMDVNIEPVADKFCMNESDWYEYKPRRPFSKTQIRLKAGRYLKKNFSEKRIVSSNFTIVRHN